MSDRYQAIRSLGAKAAFGAIVASSLIVAACGPTPGATTSNPSLTACSVSVSDFTSTVKTTGMAPKVAGVSGKIAVDGSSALAPLFSAAAAEFDSANGTSTTVTPNGSGTGLKDVNAGAVQIGLSDVYAVEKEPSAGAYGKLADHQVAVVAFTLIVNNDLKGKVGNLTKSEIQQIYFGQVSNWSQLGGPNEIITVVNRPTTSGTRSTFKTWMLDNKNESNSGAIAQDNTGAVVQTIAQTPGAIGYVTTGFAITHPNAVSPICIDGGKPTAADISAGKYQFWGVEHAYTNGPAAGGAKALLQYVLSDQIQKNDLLKLGYLPIGEISSSAIKAHTPSGAPAPEQLPPLS
ncbi:MAG TPA: phosphate ABC transporter substrate-binding protein [Ktedonobacterales bacterium]|nr:phosphate ABC transporter substrate-binding protein [Ktedonobacterales bacterium]